MDLTDPTGEGIQFQNRKTKRCASSHSPGLQHVRHNSTGSDSVGPRERTSFLYVLCLVIVPERAPSISDGRGLTRRATSGSYPSRRRRRKCCQVYSRMCQAEEINPIRASIQPSRSKSHNQGQCLSSLQTHEANRSLSQMVQILAVYVIFYPRNRPHFWRFSGVEQVLTVCPVSVGSQPPSITCDRVPSRHRRRQGDAQNNGRCSLVCRRFR